MRYNRTICLLAVALLFPLSAAATTGNPGGGLVIIPLMLFSPVPAILLVIEVILRMGRPNKPINVRIILAVAIAAIYAMYYIDGFIEGWPDGESAIFLSSFLFLVSLGFIYIFIRSVGWRVLSMFGAMMLLVVLNLLTPSVITFDYYEFVDNEPIENSTHTLKILNGGYAVLSDGRIFFFENGTYNYPIITPVAMTPTGKDTYRFFVKTSTEFTPSELRKYKRVESALVQVPRNKIAVNKYMRRELGEGSLVTKEKDVEIRDKYKLAQP